MRFSLFGRLRGLAILIACSFAILPIHASACSVCIAHAMGAAMHGIGAQTIERGSLVVGQSYLDFAKTNAGDDPGTFEHETYREFGVNAAYGLTDRWQLRATLPWVQKSILADGSPRQSSQGLGDMSLEALYQLPPSVRGHSLIALTVDMKAPTGANSLRDPNGTLRDQHVQLGTGSWDVGAGVNITGEGRKVGQLWFAGLRTRMNGTNNRGYHYGDVLFYDAGFVQPLAGRSALVAEFNGRVAGKDRREDGTLDGNTGGHLGYVSLSYRVGLAGQLGLIATWQQPVLRQLNGFQSEGRLVSVTVSRAF